MMNKEEVFNKWMDDLIGLADTESIDLELHKTSYYTYFSSGFTPNDVIDDFKGLTDKVNDERPQAHSQS